MVALGSSLDELKATYGDPTESKSEEDFPGAVTYTFEGSDFHEVVVVVVDGLAGSITYWSVFPSPASDLRHVMDSYGERVGWREVERGYWYWRNDDKVRLWCSVAPAIGVATADYFEEKSRREEEWRASQPITFSEDIEWTPNKTIEEMQSRFIAGDETWLREFEKRSTQIAVSSDGRTVIVVRDHFAHSFEAGFTDQNRPPGEGEKSTRVINVFSRPEGPGLTWGKVTLPRDAIVDFVRFNDGQLELRLRQVPDGRVLEFSGELREILPGLSNTNLGDEHLWAVLAKTAKDRGT